ncbi:MAG: Rrf2 family transcriptional regulator [Phycisphaerae bacterium]|nr:Rrf2 family transcriptional regulator [Phycisphaerae bacterium]
MDIIRRNTDYALRIAAALAGAFENQTSLSARQLSSQCSVPYAIACKILQKLVKAKVAESIMGAKGGFRLAGPPQQIRFGQVVEAIQGRVCVNRCLLGSFRCPLNKHCPAHPKLAVLQSQIDVFLNELTLKEFVHRENRNE